jgi:hypothetical protein
MGVLRQNWNVFESKDLVGHGAASKSGRSVSYRVAARAPNWDIRRMFELFWGWLRALFRSRSW